MPRVLVWDGEGAIGRWRAGRPELTAECQAFRGTLGAKVVVCKPADPEAKGLIERAHDYLERSFLPGRAFTCPADFNAQLQQWLALVNARPRRALGCAPADRITADKAAMLAPAAGGPGDRVAVLGPAGPRPLRPAGRQRLLGAPGRDRPPDRGDRRPGPGPRAFCDGRVVADHERIWAWHQTITDPEHHAAAKALRRQRVGRAAAGAANPRSSSATWPTTTPRSGSAPTAGWPDGRPRPRRRPGT